MEDVVLAVVPVGERCTITASLLNRFGWLYDFINFARGPFTFFPSELGLVCRGEVHPVWVDNLAFFLEIEGLLVGFNFGLGEFRVVVLAIVGEECLGVGVLHKSICASSHSGALVLVPRGQWVIFMANQKSY